MTGAYLDLYGQLSPLIPRDRLIHDDVRRLAYGTDASFYRLIPQLVVKVENEAEAAAVIERCRAAGLPLVFRAAGTSLSGQAVTDSVLMQIAGTWSGIQVEEGAGRVTLAPAVIGARANRALAPYGRKIGPDPASVNSAMVGGIAANNASGMCCGTAQNSYRTLDSMRVMLADGAVLDTSSAASRAAFREERPELVAQIAELAARTRANSALAERIRRKYAMKNTTGYSLNALVDFEDPLEIIQHLMIGSEGTLGFISSITYRTVPDPPAKATALMCFPDVRTACAATTLLRRSGVMSAVEIMDRASLRSVEEKSGMPGFLKGLPEDVAALLMEVRAETGAGLRERIHTAIEALGDLPIVEQAPFTEDAAEAARLWNVRKGLFPSVGAVREIGTTVIIEDVAFPFDRLADGAVDLQKLFRKYGYHEAIIFGHALEGNLHFVFTQDFGSEREIYRYRDFIDEVVHMVVGRYDGALKAEHGTGRNMAPFVELEWGVEAYAAMREIKSIFDPAGLLNPGVILNSDPQAHLKDLKALPKAHALVDRCIECGFCEVNCPSRNLTLTPRQRIVVWREISRLRDNGGDAARLARLLDGFSYQGEATCAADGLCSLACPVEIDTGKLVKELRLQSHSRLAHATADWVANHMGAVTAGLRFLLNTADLAHAALGPAAMGAVTGAMRKLSGGLVPQWNRYLPRGADAVRQEPAGGADKVVYFPSCVARAMGAARGAPEGDSLTTRTAALLRKAGYDVVYPRRLGELCCGMAFASKGFKRQGDRKLAELKEALREASEGGRFPVLFDTSPCLERVREALAGEGAPEIFEPARFAERYLVPRLRWTRLPGTVALHVPCSSRKMGLEGALRAVAKRCAERVVIPEDVGCCGFAGDRGFHYPELTASALQPLRQAIPEDCREGYSTSRACEIGLSLHAGIHYRSLFYLVDAATEPLERR